ncbi:hypothetical protein EDD18DRAFT_1440925 [Armillaria luteobubalina]|uniref:Uncharacterized protein n=1 Tax=Armillaria luteobubalina TaxID=153913 RepID=A0AA39QAH2_9AGAR|nr:hypothetical protein EDD18DRAFT_1440925 [Armillaria luteobubalina]
MDLIVSRAILLLRSTNTVSFLFVFLYRRFWVTYPGAEGLFTGQAARKDATVLFEAEHGHHFEGYIFNLGPSGDCEEPSLDELYRLTRLAPFTDVLQDSNSHHDTIKLSGLLGPTYCHFAGERKMQRKMHCVRLIHVPSSSSAQSWLRNAASHIHLCLAISWFTLGGLERNDWIRSIQLVGCPRESFSAIKLTGECFNLVELTHFRSKSLSCLLSSLRADGKTAMSASQLNTPSAITSMTEYKQCTPVLCCDYSLGFYCSCYPRLKSRESISRVIPSVKSLSDTSLYFM